MSDLDVERLADALAEKLQGGKCGQQAACCAKCSLTPEEHAEQHRAMSGALKMRSVVVVKILEWGAVAIVAWVAMRMGWVGTPRP
ncbi:hypothetical protein [Solidesulfovibrio sp. C21]|uniref:hypothetical protein n=1 Tax=Solidesulfovibrio sp. C21 TaxID=3398613 RepID=UPI0039FC99FD